MKDKLRNCLEWYLTKKIGTEIKSCLVFFIALCFYCIYNWCIGSTQVEIIPMFIMVILAYLMIWIQVFIHSDFDEIDRLGIKEWGVVILSPVIFTIAARLGHWFDDKIAVELGFLVYMIVAYLCTYWIYAIKRSIDAKLLNNDLKRFQQRDRMKE